MSKDKWIYVSNEMCNPMYKCKYCGHIIELSFTDEKPFPNTCPKCNSDMRGEDNG